MKISLFSCLLLTVFLVHHFETKAQVVLAKTDLESLLDKTEKATLQYSETFKNLSAEEMKICQDFHKNGGFGEKRVIKSNFIVYQSPRSNNSYEFRYVFEYNGKQIEENYSKIANFFQQIEKSVNDADEVAKLKNESVRFDGKISTWGFTLKQPSPLGKLRSFFDFKALSKETINNRNVFVVQYIQNRPTPLILVNPIQSEYSNDFDRNQYILDIPSKIGSTNPNWEGKLWLDAETGQILKNEFKVIIHPKQFNKSVVCLEFLHEYQQSGYKILTPKRFQVTIYKILGTTDKDFRSVKQRETDFEYYNFREFKTDTKDFDKRQNQAKETIQSIK